ncbi:MAG: L,D-transpeptidase family protein [Pseudomonadales bacterium]|nr:L,D-transpeptidase family protein [Pseudomonadales bacterium]
MFRSRIRNSALVVLWMLVCSLCFADEHTHADLVLVKKAERKMYLLAGGAVIREYRISLGANPVGHKQRSGDERTPEGVYWLDYKKPDSDFYKAIHISYPNRRDRARAAQDGVDPGGQIMIHGQSENGYWPVDVRQLFDWTDGCIAVTDPEMDEIWQLVRIGTRIEIRP